MSNFYLLLSIGPVQSAIGQARKTQDLYEASRLLSWLSYNGLQHVISEHKGAPVYPNFKSKESSFYSIPSLPNRFLVAFEAKDLEAAKGVGEVAEAKVREAFFALAKNRLDIVKPNDQLDNWLEIYWVVIEATADFGTDQKNIEGVMGGVKSARPFVQLMETGRKCGLCGERNIKYYKALPSEDDIKVKTTKVEQKLFSTEEAVIWYDSNGKYKDKTIKHSELQRGEGLCDVCALKRFKTESSFPSTAQIAIYNLEKLIGENEVLRVKCREFKKLFGDTPADFNYQYLFEENLTSLDVVKKLGFDCDFEKFKEIHQKYRDLTSELYKHSLRMPRYYAMVMYDVDGMGDWLSGEKFNGSASSEDKMKFHRRFSELLFDFGQAAADKINKDYCKGHSVYDGGDDFLGFFNIDHLLPLLKWLRDEFDKQVGAVLVKEFEKHLKEGASLPTFSAGITIAHYKTPLGEVLRLTREAEKIAKNHPGKKAFSITMDKRAGNRHNTVWGWDKLTILENITKLQIEDCLPGDFAYRLLGSFEQMVDDKGIADGLEDGMLTQEFLRLARRTSGYALKREEVTKTLGEMLGSLSFAAENDFMNLIYLLEAAEFISRNQTTSVQETTPSIIG